MAVERAIAGSGDGGYQRSWASLGGSSGVLGQLLLKVGAWPLVTVSVFEWIRPRVGKLAQLPRYLYGAKTFGWLMTKNKRPLQQSFSKMIHATLPQDSWHTTLTNGIS